MKRKRIVAIFLGAVLAGCGPFKMPKPPRPIRTPEAAITAVRLVNVGDRAARFDVDVTLSNPNDQPLPLTHAKYELKIEGVGYASDAIPKTTLPANGQITVTLPAILEGNGAVPVDGEFRVSGRIEMTPSGQVRKLFYDLGLPKPRVSFDGLGAVTATPPRPAAGN